MPVPLCDATGNTTQWIDGYPSEALIRREIEESHSFACIDEQGEILGTFCFILGEDPTYQQFNEGAWLNDDLMECSPVGNERKAERGVGSLSGLVFRTLA